MKTTILKGKTRRGKHKLQQHGKVWEILKDTPQAVLLQSLGMTFRHDGMVSKDLRWVRKGNDKDFTITKEN